MIKIKNCNNIDSAEISIEKDYLNLKYAINWTGKTTIAKAIKYSIDDRINWTNTLKTLKPFKFLDSDENNPEILGLDDFKNISIFNEEYIEKYTFEQGQIHKNSFEIFIEDDKYKEWLIEINKLVDKIRGAFQENEDINNFINDLKNFISYAWKSNSSVSASWSMMKWFWDWNKVDNIPTELKEYSEYIRSDDKVKWLWWQMWWNDFIDISDWSCPYCISWISEKKEKILKVSEIYDKKAIEHLNKVVEVIQNLSKYFSDETNSEINTLIWNVDWLTDDQKKYLFDIKQESEKLLEKLNKIKNINFHSLKNIDELEKEINNYKIEVKYYNYFNSQHSQDKYTIINNELDTIIEQIGLLKGAVNKQKLHIKNTIDTYKNEMNDFLKYAWYNYIIDSKEEDNNYKLILQHNDNSNLVNNAKNHLSYWERNAFALVLFMFESIKKGSDLIILDDPISSFDKNKKFAILNMLFAKKWEAWRLHNFRGKTVIMLTHDFEPVIDIIYNNLPVLFSKKAYFLENNTWNLKEKEIQKSDIRSFIDIAEKNIKSLDENINKLIYLRRLCEIDNVKIDAYELLSNLFHKREIPKYIEFVENEKKEIDIPAENIKKGVEIISEIINDFEYDKYFAFVNDEDFINELYDRATNNYEKLQLYRMINKNNHENGVIKKFINECFHIENDYLFQLNPCEYQIVPQYIIDECDKFKKPLSNFPKQQLNKPNPQTPNST